MTLRAADVAGIIEEWAPRTIAWEKDNVGLQCGNPDAPVRRILVSLDITPDLLREAVRRRVNMIVSHHPLLFHPLRQVNTATRQGDMVSTAIRHRIVLYAAHTNLDFTRGGTSFVLAETLGLREIRFLAQETAPFKKIVTFVPHADTERVATAMSAAGGGRIGHYDACSFRTAGTGTFRGDEYSSPRIGARGRVQRVEELRLEMLVDERHLSDVLGALRATHPYEEVAFDVYPLDNLHPDAGMGAIGTLPAPLSPGAFLRRTRKALHAGPLRYARGTGAPIRQVAVCGGSGSDLLPNAIASGAQAFVTADIRYHSYHEAAGRICLVDAGHYETELPVVAAVARRLQQSLHLHHPRVQVLASSTRTSPIGIV